VAVKQWTDSDAAFYLLILYLWEATKFSLRKLIITLNSNKFTILKLKSNTL